MGRRNRSKVDYATDTGIEGGGLWYDSDKHTTPQNSLAYIKKAKHNLGEKTVPG